MSADDVPLWYHALSLWYFIPIEDLNLSMRTYNCLRRSNLVYVGQVLAKTPRELLELHSFGRRSYYELREKLDEFGIIPYDGSLLEGDESK